MRKGLYFVGVLLGSAAAASASTIVSYTATAAPNLTPDGTDQTGAAVDVWQETIKPGTSGGAGSYLNNGWEIYSYPDQTGGIIDERHTFTGGAIAVGQRVSLTFANSAIQSGQSVGFSLTGGSTPISFSFTGGDTSGHYRYSDTSGTSQDSGLSFLYQTNFPVSFTFTSPTTYTASANGVTYSGTYSGAVTGIDVFNNAAGNSSDVAFNNLSVTAVPEPASLGLLAMAGLAAFGRRRR